MPVIQFRKGQRKDDIAAEQRKKFKKAEGVVFIGKAQEKMPVFRTERRRNEKTGVSYPWMVRSTAMVNQPMRGCCAPNSPRSCPRHRRSRQRSEPHSTALPQQSTPAVKSNDSPPKKT